MLKYGNLPPFSDRRNALVVVHGEKVIAQFYVDLVDRVAPLLKMGPLERTSAVAEMGPVRRGGGHGGWGATVDGLGGGEREAEKRGWGSAVFSVELCVRVEWAATRDRSIVLAHEPIYPPTPGHRPGTKTRVGASIENDMRSWIADLHQALCASGL